jgi:DNA-binding transcriptional LysR family regulator
MHEFIAMYPDIDVSLVLSDNELDLGMREADVAIRMVMPRQPGLVQRHLLTVRSHVYASHGYIQKYGKPKTVEELDQHRLIIFGEDARAPVQDVNWLLHEGNVDPSLRVVVLRVNNVYGIFRAVESGLGIASLPDYLARESTKLEMVLPDLNVRTTDVYFTYPEELRHSKRIASRQPDVQVCIANARHALTACQRSPHRLYQYTGQGIGCLQVFDTKSLF